MKTLLFMATLVLFPALKATAASPEPFPFVHRSFDFVFSWRMKATAAGFTIEGAARNVRFLITEDIEIKGALLDDDGKKLAECRALTIPPVVREGDEAPFRLFLSIPAGARPATLQFRYTYHWNEGDGFTGSDLQEFDVPLEETSAGPSEEPGAASPAPAS